MKDLYVEKVDDVYQVRGSRVSLDSIVHAYWNGQTAESIAQSFPGVSLEQVFGSLTFYLSHQVEVDAYLHRGQAEFEAQREAARRNDPMFYKKMADARKAQQSANS
jgi:uncharacterized protein (DUF433 family)